MQSEDRSPRPVRRWVADIRQILVLGVVACLGSVMSCIAAGGSVAAPIDDFYTPPAQFATVPGSVIKTASMPVFVAPPGIGGTWPVNAQKVMYTSRTQDDAPVAVSGTFIDSTQPWRGSGPRPTVVIAPGTVGQGRQCAASLAFSTGLYAEADSLSISPNQEALSAIAWNSLGARVFVTDYIGLGTPGIHTYANRVEQAHAVLDAARATLELSGAGADTPLAIWGYSQGGGASAAAAEMQPSYAPELNLKGTWAGAPTADLAAVVDRIDGTLIGAAVGYAINGFVARYPQLQPEVDRRMTPAGRVLLEDLKTECIGDLVLRHPFMQTGEFTIDHRPLADHLREIPEVVAIVGEQRIGGLRPTSPVLISSGINDDTVPYGQARQLAIDWCGNGATVTFRSNSLPPIAPGATIPNHFGPELIDGFGTNNAIGYLIDRLDGKPIQGCTFE